ncbi:MAG: response regulator transcription factor [Betaproteobacteria bacterium]|nr:response regulator transcription factor [Betaproteobacteria bacterium]
MPTALIADDEPLLADQLRRKLAQLWPELEIRAVVSSGRAAVDAAADHHPDICFLDIRMPVMNGIEAARLIGGESRVVFVTAYDEYAIDAFERGAVDYLLKPIAEDRLRATIARLRAAVAQPPADLSTLLSQLAGRLQPQASAYLSWVRAGVGDTVRLIAIEDVLFFQAGDKYTRVVTRTGEAWIRTTIKELAASLDPARFWQVHRSTLVNVREIASMERTNRDSGELRLKDHPGRIDVSRGYLHRFRQM